MASLKIPDEALPDLKKIADINESLFNSFYSVVSKTSPTLRPSQFEQLIVSKTKGIPRGTVRSILSAIFFFYKLKEKLEISARDLTESVVSSAKVSTSGDFSTKSREKLKKRLDLLLNLDKSLGVTAKALDVMTEHERIFCSARIVSDIRPVFSGGPKEASGAVIIHNLQIGFHSNGEHEDIYFALDTDDIQMLKDVIDRAEKKTIAMQSILNKSHVPYLEV